MVMGFLQSFSYAEIAGMFGNKSVGASVCGAMAWLRYSKFIAPLSARFARSPVLSLGCAIATGYIIFNFLNLNAGWIHRMDSGHIQRPWKAPTWQIWALALAAVLVLFLLRGTPFLCGALPCQCGGAVGRLDHRDHAVVEGQRHLADPADHHRPQRAAEFRARTSGQGFQDRARAGSDPDPRLSWLGVVAAVFLAGRAYGGVKQVIMLALNMVIIASMIGAGGLGYDVLLALRALKIGEAMIGTRDLGQEVFIALSKADSGRGIVVGLAIAFIGIIADRLFNAMSARSRNRLTA